MASRKLKTEAPADNDSNQNQYSPPIALEELNRKLYAISSAVDSGYLKGGSEEDESSRLTRANVFVDAMSTCLWILALDDHSLPTPIRDLVRNWVTQAYVTLLNQLSMVSVDTGAVQAVVKGLR